MDLGAAGEGGRDDDMDHQYLHNDDDDGAQYEAGGAPGQGQETGANRRACDQCRSKKVGCDREDPCSNCLRGQAHCTYTINQSARPKRQRVLISAQYERKIDRIEERLSQVIGLLRNASLDKPISSVSGQSTASSATPPKDESSSAGRKASSDFRRISNTPGTSSVQSQQSPGPHSNADSAPFEGESSMAAHTGFASDFIEKTLKSAPTPAITVEVEDTLTALRQMVTAQSQKSHTDMTFPSARSEHLGANASRPKINSQLAMASLKAAKEHPEIEFQWLSGIITQERFTNYAISVLFSAEYSEAEYIFVHLGFYWLFAALEELSGGVNLGDMLRSEVLAQESDVCRINVETALSQMRYHMAHDYEWVLALAAAAIYVIELSKATLAWTYISSALNICHNLGYHRRHHMEKCKPETRRERGMIFWTLYVLEKGLSLRLGRHSGIQDYDIDLPLPSDDTIGLYDGSIEEYYNIANKYWVRVAAIQGRTYEQLYSPYALRQPDSYRAERSRALANELLSVMRKPPENPVVPLSLASVAFLTNEVVQLATLTLIYRAMPVPADSPSIFSQECIETARSTLDHHQAVMTAIPAETDMMFIYLHWSILYVPFVPFIVIFCHAMKTSDEADLHRLGAHVASLEASTKTCEALARLHNLFQVLHSVAQKYVESKSSTAQVQVQKEFDTYIQALGLGNAEFEMAHATPGTVAGLSEGGFPHVIDGQTMSMPQNGAMLGDWFYGNQQMMGLLEQDTFEFVDM